MPHTWITFSIGLYLSTAMILPTNLLGDEASSSQRGGTTGSSTSSALRSSQSNVSRNISINENGRRISITENNSGITVTTAQTVNGDEQMTEVRAASPQELKEKDPEAYRQYERHLGGSKAVAGAWAGAGSGSNVGDGAVLQNSARQSGGLSSSRAISSSSSGGSSSSGTSRSVSFSENGRTVTITENGESGITVTIAESIDGEEKKTVVKAANLRALKRKSPEAYRLYKSHIDRARAHADASGSAGTSDAQEMLREHLRQQIKENADNPQVQAMLERMLGELGK